MAVRCPLGMRSVSDLSTRRPGRDGYVKLTASKMISPRGAAAAEAAASSASCSESASSASGAAAASGAAESAAVVVVVLLRSRARGSR